MRDDQADEADHAAHRHRGADQERRGDEDGASCPLHVDAQLGCTFLTGGQQVQVLRMSGEPGEPGERVRRGRRDELPALSRERAHQPEEHAVRLRIARDHIDQHDGGRGEDVEHDPDQQERIRRGAPTGARAEVDDADREERTGKGRERHDERDRLGPRDERHDTPHRSPARDAEEVGAGERVREQRLKRGPRRAEAAAHDGAEEHARQPRAE